MLINVVYNDILHPHSDELHPIFLLVLFSTNDFFALVLRIFIKGVCCLVICPFLSFLFSCRIVTQMDLPNGRFKQSAIADI